MKKQLLYTLIKLIDMWWFRILIFILISFCVSYIRRELRVNYNGFYAVGKTRYAMYPYIVVVGGYFFYFRGDTVKEKIVIISLIAIFIFLQFFIFRFLFS